MGIGKLSREGEENYFCSCKGIKREKDRWFHEEYAQQRMFLEELGELLKKYDAEISSDLDRVARDNLFLYVGKAVIEVKGDNISLETLKEIEL